MKKNTNINSMCHNNVSIMKKYEIPVPRFVMKMLIRDYGYKDHLPIDKCQYGKRMGNSIWTRYRIENVGKQESVITIHSESKVPIWKLYSIMIWMKAEFHMKMLYYIEGSVEGGAQARESIRTFFKKYDILPEDMKLNTAFKRFQRHK